ncbi:4-alpha-glucanotransferase [Gracilinema caldarium]|uniref:4-alpha-glucanotransferase n=1 Tax=Gracilinema caldarium (strain ATCC 51460 / DSM 7334 / H1) TaxID=744872 RepID=F8EY51_GRAC1|nr:4-alpha-glucanotransferase [Gracilinema caldarium]AEJ20712.1 4-alpha-glucanotransferase [Gracilinema caldarium DSM 7334]
MHLSNQTKRLTGVAVPLGALKTQHSIGVGEFPDLVELAHLCKSCGIGLIQLLPVNDSGFQSSPYSALTAFALHPLYLRISDMEEASGFEKKLQELKARFENLPRFAYGPLQDAKLALLREIFQKNKKKIFANAEPGKKLHTWIQQNPWIIDYAVYRRLKDVHHGAHWNAWNYYKEVKDKLIQELWDNSEYKEEHLFWVWIQAALDHQFTKAAQTIRDMGIILKGDIPILMNEDSADVWAHSELFYRDLSAGAPPEPLNPLGQNWQFPIYNWDALEKSGFAWWIHRLRLASRYYSAFRIDHVLGFFRIWATSRKNMSAALGHFVPSVPITTEELSNLGFDDSRIRWLVQPHIPTHELFEAMQGDPTTEAAVRKACAKALTRIGNEELWLFNNAISGEIDIQALDIHHSLKEYLLRAWRNRVLIPQEDKTYYPSWTYWDTRAFPTLSESERRNLESLIQQKRLESEQLWEDQGRKLLSTFLHATDMIPCAEDLGTIPECVPRVLQELGILSLKIVRWTRRWGEWGEPYIPFTEYPELSVCTPAVHDTSTVRQWWETEADREQFRQFINVPYINDRYTPETAELLFSHIMQTRSRFCIFQIQDLLHLSLQWYAEDPEDERINVPGSVNDFNWTYRLPSTLETIQKDETFIAACKRLTSNRR